MTYQPSIYWNRLIITGLLWSLVASIIISVSMPVWLVGLLLLLTMLASIIIWKWQQAQMFFNPAYLREKLRWLSDDELQETHESMAELRAIFDPHKGSKLVDSLVTQLDENQLLVMQERLHRADIFTGDETTHVNDPLVYNYPPRIEAGLGTSPAD